MHHLKGTQAFLRCALLCFLLLLAKAATFSQTLTFDVSHAPVTTLTIGDIDFKTFGSSNWLFTLAIHYTGDVVLQAEISVVLADGTPIANPAATLVTTPFAVNGTKTITNLDIGKTDIKTQTFDYKEDAKDKLKNLAMGTGKLPAGVYTFVITISDPSYPNDPTKKATQNIIFDIENLSRLDLIAPQDGIPVNTLFPLFQWLYDGTDVQLSVYEMRGNDRSKEDALSGTPMLKITTGTPDFPAGARSYQYPAAGVRPLEVGKTYVWQVKGLTGGSGGAGNPVNSEIWQFTVSDPNGTTLYSNTGENSRTTLTRVLYLLPGMTQDLINQLTAGNFQVTGDIYVDGVHLTASDAAAILNMLAENPDKVIEVTVVQE